MNRYQRLLAFLDGKPADRPAVNFYEIGEFRMDPSDNDPFNIYNDLSWKPLIDLAEEQTDLIRMRRPVRANSHESWDGSNMSTESVRSQGCKFQLGSKVKMDISLHSLMGCRYKTNRINCENPNKGTNRSS
ncbi:MAG: hypothetical protein JXA82_10765 [Sedimentisphaerales bacterium]|nr:hypothetical protein [Sedimentisphaerales bacterium]